MDDELRAIRAAQYKRMRESTQIAADAEEDAPESKRLRVTSQSSSSADLRILTWNVDGLDCERGPEDLALRAAAVCEVIMSELPDVVYLQELIEVNLKLFSKALSSLYHLNVQQSPSHPYFVAVLIRSGVLRPLSTETVSFANSKMGRALVAVKVERVLSPPRKFFLGCAHLESGRESAAERKNQLSECFSFFEDAKLPAVFGGDLNLRDQEVHSAVAIDAWEACGKQDDSRYTWDTMLNDNVLIEGKSKPRCRFDRLYSFGGVTASSFKLVGDHRILALGRFPSDHFGIVATFKLS